MREELWLMNADGSNQRYLGVEGFAAKWSADGSSIVFYSGAFKEWEDFTINTDGTNLQQITDLPVGKTAINPIWKPVLK